MMTTMSEYNLTKLAELGEKYERLREDTEVVGKLVAAEAEAARLAGVAQVEIVKASRLTRERLRQIRIAREKVAAEEAAKKPTKRAPAKKS